MLCVNFIREWCLNKAWIYCDIIWKSCRTLQNVCENCVKILEEEKQRQLRIFVILWKNVKEIGILIDKPKRVKPKTVRTPENIGAVAESVREAPSQCSQQLNISETSLRLILRRDFGITPYKVQLVQELKPVDHPMRSRFARCACDRLTEDAVLWKKNHLFRWSSFWS